MKLKEFEQAIIAKGLKPKEVRLEHSNVKWFVCDGNYDYGIIVFDKNGKAYVLFTYQWPEEVHNIQIESCDGGITIDGVTAYRDCVLDLVF